MAQTLRDQAATPPDPLAVERRAIRLSAVGAAVMAVVGVAWGLAISSQVILFDGLYALVGLALSWSGLWALRAVAAGPSARYPFGREAVGPLVVAAQALVLIGTFGYAVVDAVLAIRDGGSEVTAGWALGYGVATLVLSAVFRARLRRMQGTSELVAAEVTQWAAGALLSVAMVVGFTAALLLQRSDWAGAAPYVDPVLVILAVGAFSPEPVKMLVGTARELLEAAPGRDVASAVQAAVEEVRARHGLPEPTTRLGKVGRKLYVELDFVVGDAPWTVAGTDRLRRELTAALAAPGRELWLVLELHATPDWDGPGPAGPPAAGPAGAPAGPGAA